jgi:ribosomal protein S18 acetylase RimI-like enzyme
VSVRYSICRPDEVSEMLDLLAEAFARRDPPAVAVGLTSRDMATILSMMSARAGADGLSVVARDDDSGVMAGALLNDDAARSAELDPATLSPRFGPILDLFRELDDVVEDAGTIEPGTTLHVSMLGVSDRFAGQGIAQRLVETALANAAVLGYRSAVTEATNLVSQHIFEKLGFTARAQASYATYRRGGVPTFASIAEHGGITSMTRPQLSGSPSLPD